MAISTNRAMHVIFCDPDTGLPLDNPGGGGISGTLIPRSATVALSAGVAAATVFDYSADVVTSVRLSIVRTSGTAPAIPNLAYAIVRTAAGGAPVAADFDNASPDDGTVTEERIPFQTDETGNMSIVIDPDVAMRYVGVRFAAVTTGGNHRIFCTAAS